MNNLTHFKVTAAPRQALAKLSRAQIPVYDCKKQGAFFAFAVKDNFVKKVFAIFARPCYNITIEHKSFRARLKLFVARRAFLIAGCALFCLCAAISNLFVFRITVTGSGAHLSNAVRSIAYSLGVREYSFYRGLDEASFISRVLELPEVTFCSVHKSGSVVYIDVQTEEETALSADYSDLYADCAGTLKKLVTVCGTPLAKEGDTLSRGDRLIGAYTILEDKSVPCLAAGYAVIERSLSISYPADADNEQNLASALASVLAYTGDEQITSRSAEVHSTAEGVIYTVNFSYLHTVSINF